VLSLYNPPLVAPKAKVKASRKRSTAEKQRETPKHAQRQGATNREEK
jgi:hypothetical protein